MIDTNKKSRSENTSSTEMLGMLLQSHKYRQVSVTFLTHTNTQARAHTHTHQIATVRLSLSAEP